KSTFKVDLAKEFFTAPSVEIFDKLIGADVDLYTNVDDPTEDLYVELEGETDETRAQRIRKLKKTPPTKSLVKSNFCNPITLSWAYAAVWKFPWLATSCAKPLYVERA